MRSLPLSKLGLKRETIQKLAFKGIHSTAQLFHNAPPTVMSDAELRDLVCCLTNARLFPPWVLTYKPCVQSITSKEADGDDSRWAPMAGPYSESEQWMMVQCVESLTRAKIECRLVEQKDSNGETFFHVYRAKKGMVEESPGLAAA
jgi:hypothetical protein